MAPVPESGRMAPWVILGWILGLALIALGLQRGIQGPEGSEATPEQHGGPESKRGASSAPIATDLDGVDLPRTPKDAGGAHGTRARLPATERRIPGILVDGRTGEALPEIRLELRRAGRPLGSITSDARGRVHFPASVRPQDFKVEAIDARSGALLDVLSMEFTEGDELPSMPVDVEDGALEPGADSGPHGRVSVRIGPSYRVAPTPNLDQRDLWGRWILELDRGELLRGPWAPVHRESGNTLRFAAPFDGPLVPTAPVGNTVVWVSMDPSRLRSGSLELSTRSPHSDPGDLRVWSGRSPVARLRGQHGELIPIELRLQATVFGRVLDERGEAVEGARLHLVPTDTPEGSLGDWIQATSGPEGRFEFPPTEPGPFSLWVSAPGHVEAHRRIDGAPGPVALGELTLPRTPPSGSIAGTIQLSGVEDVELDLRLHCTDQGHPDRIERIVLDAEVPLEFEFESVPHGVWQLTAEGLPGVRLLADGGEDHDPSSMVPPRRKLALRVEIRGGVRPLVFDALDLESGETVEDYELLLRGPGDPWLHAFGFSGSPDFDAVDGEPLDWILIAPGYRPVRGTERAFAAQGDLLRATVELERGHGSAILLKDATRWLSGRHGVLGSNRLDPDPPGPPEFSPLPGIRVLGGGRPLGFTDDSGLLLLDNEAPFGALSIEARPWVLLRELPPSHEALGGRIAVGYLLKLP